MIHMVRTTSDSQDFRTLVALLDEDLIQRYGDLQKQYARFNRIDRIYTVVVAYEDEKPVGCGCFRVFEADSVEIKRMYVVPENRGKGIARNILAELENWAIEKGFARSVLETGIKQAEAIGLYSQFGYSIIPNYSYYEGNENSLCMARRLVKAEE
jgi:putative acetyltransferase